jgi:hypothetical protein
VLGAQGDDGGHVLLPQCAATAALARS